MPRGGARKGAGRPLGSKEAKTLQREAARALFRERVIAELEPLLNAQVANAKGLKYLVVRDKKTGKFLRVAEKLAGKLDPNEELVEIWEKDPSVHAFDGLIEQTFGKPSQHLEVTGANEGPVVFTWQK